MPEEAKTPRSAINETAEYSTAPNAEIERIKTLILQHEESGKLACYVLSEGQLYPETKSVYEDLIKLD